MDARHLKFWFIPTWSGDYGLERVEDEDGAHTVLTIERPTTSERSILDAFQATCVDKGWLDAVLKLTGRTRVQLTLHAPIHVAAPVLADLALPQDQTRWTAVRSVSGQVRVVLGNDPFAVDGKGGPETAGEGALSEADETVEESAGEGALSEVESDAEGGALSVTDEDAPKAAATMRRPRVGCPAPEHTTRRASEVLRTFCTISQWDEWEREGSMLVRGNHTGRRYRLFHRDEAARRGLGHVLVRPNGNEVCVWDDRVPAEEEALAIKVGVECRERDLLWNYLHRTSTGLRYARPVALKRAGPARVRRDRRAVDRMMRSIRFRRGR